jgi:inner membrane protein
VDNLCHTLVGAAFGEAGLKRRTRHAHATLMIASNLPDLDALVFLTDTSGLAFRRGWTHGLAAQVVLPVALTAAVWAIGRLRRTNAGGPPLHAGWTLALASLGVLSHVFLDFLNNYGIRLLAPFDWRWFYGDAVFIIDPWLWLALGIGIWLARRRCAPAPARASLVVAACYITVMLLSARAARTVVADAWREARGTEPLALMVGPVPANPFIRTVIVDAGDRYETGTLSWWPATVTFDPTAIPKNDRHPAVAAARAQSRGIQEFLVWSRFPFWRVMPAGAGAHVIAGDTRFMSRAARFEASTTVAIARED